MIENFVITPAEAQEKINATAGAFFRVLFVKRTTGETRDMVCRLGVRKHLAGGPPAYNFAEKGLVPVWDSQKEAYRCIPLENIRAIKVSGETYEVRA